MERVLGAIGGAPDWVTGIAVMVDAVLPQVSSCDEVSFSSLKAAPKLGELTVLCFWFPVPVEPSFRRVDNCLKRVKLVPPPAGTKGTSHPDVSC